MTNVASTYKECLKHLREMQAGNEAAFNFKQLASKYRKLQEAQDHPPKATWKKLVLDMQASVARMVICVVVTPSCVELSYNCSCAGWVCEAAAVTC